ncbi:hypothetical protein GUITHDRAFT_144698 [Guillardia theta CCMP2712]|uniref:Uncharacterized protein n=1 Tax=Guillardia theta (strain CCMP2712) TaxID=905079 RepID=L1INL5_GUITC|nr:hypothetical protein GUITHDRAFT_144698 [Guillardia theta CCMP2712]EKX37876.1 hypothetical protein GUITHDRAFT_144698 [Guillardia theta CCMP2712]|eukprot:XP_005824856.1 hypothetical protein GUITHDRAFT_144698 [Guillardia theta CCMP2712]
MDNSVIRWHDLQRFQRDSSIDKPYEGKNMFVMSFIFLGDHEQLTDIKQPWPNPIVFYDPPAEGNINLAIDPDNLYSTVKPEMRVLNREPYRDQYHRYLSVLPNFNQLHAIRKVAGQQTVQNETNVCAMSFHGDMLTCTAGGAEISRVVGSGHLEHSFVGVASVREGKGLRPVGQPSLTTMI